MENTNKLLICAIKETELLSAGEIFWFVIYLRGTNGIEFQEVIDYCWARYS